MGKLVIDKQAYEAFFKEEESNEWLEKRRREDKIYYDQHCDEVIDEIKLVCKKDDFLYESIDRINSNNFRRFEHLLEHINTKRSQVYDLDDLEYDYSEISTELLRMKLDKPYKTIFTTNNIHEMRFDSSLDDVICRVAYYIDVFLLMNDIEFQKEVTCNMLNSEVADQMNIKKCRFDYYLPEFNCLIEFDDISHFEPVYGKRKLEATQRNDALKGQFAEKLGMTLLRINYGCKFYEIKNQIVECLTQCIELSNQDQNKANDLKILYAYYKVKPYIDTYMYYSVIETFDYCVNVNILHAYINKYVEVSRNDVLYILKLYLYKNFITSRFSSFKLHSHKRSNMTFIDHQKKFAKDHNLKLSYIELYIDYIHF